MRKEMALTSRRLERPGLTALIFAGLVAPRIVEAQEQSLKEALGDKSGIRRFASIVVPLDEAAVEVALDLAGRTFVVHEVPVPAETIGTFDTGLVEDFVRAFAQAAELTVHVHLKHGRSPHHVCEAEFKALAKALGDACALTGPGGVPSTKGAL